MSTKEYVADYEYSEICALCYYADRDVLVDDVDNIDINLCDDCTRDFRSDLQGNIDTKIKEINESDKTLRELVSSACTRDFPNEYRVTELSELRTLLKDALDVAARTTLFYRLSAEITEDIESMRFRCLQMLLINHE